MKTNSSPNRLIRVIHSDQIIFWAVCLFLMALAFANYQDFGVSWDEPRQVQYGSLVVSYFLSGFQDLRACHFFDVHFYGPLLEVFLYIFAAENYELRHLLLGLLAVATVPAVWKTGKLLGGKSVSFFSVLVLLSMPRLIGHAFFNSKDIPFMWSFAWVMYYIVSLSCRVSTCGVKKGISWPSLLGFVLATGICLSIRPGGLIPVLALAFSALCVSAWIGEVGIKGFRQMTLGLCWTVIVALLIASVSWPYAHQDLIGNIIESIRFASSYPLKLPVLLEGEYYASNNLPGWYLPWYLIITTPVISLFCSVMGFTLLLQKIYKNIKSSEAVAGVTIIFWLVIPVAGVILLRSSIYDGIRHFLFILPAIALMAGKFFSYLWKQDSIPPKLLSVLLGVLMLTFSWKEIYILHPYQYTYFNFLVGGVESAYGRYDTCLL